MRPVEVTQKWKMCHTFASIRSKAGPKCLKRAKIGIRNMTYLKNKTHLLPIRNSFV